MKNTKIECTCIDMTIEGLGVCKHDSLVIFVKQMLVGEVAIVKIISHKKNLAYGIIDTMIKESPYRIKSPCSVAYKCGGCDLRHVTYDYSLKIKKDLAINTFNKMAKLDVKVEDVIASPLKDYYRNKVQIPVKDKEIGFYRKNSNDIVKFDTCLIQSETQNLILTTLKQLIDEYDIANMIRHIIIKEAFGTKEVMIALVVKSFEIKNIDVIVAEMVSKFKVIKSFILNEKLSDDNVVLGDRELVLYGSDYIMDEFDGLSVEISLKSFYQVNHGQMIQLYNQVLKLADIDKNSRVLDLFSGIGTISMFLARYAKEVTGVEIVKEAVEDANRNAKLNKLDNLKFYLGDAKDDLDKYLVDKDVVVVDPPRKGLHIDVVNKLIKHEISKIVYVSCNPATLARDLAIFKEGGYSFDTIHLFDMFPHTMHVESIVLLSKLHIKQNIEAESEMSELDLTAMKSKVTYE